MTSSLVGSEMCIRDSIKAVCRASLGAEARGLTEGAEAMEWIGSLLFETVSYTHLTLPTICSV
eukprot:1689634-Prorocentrum_lima.AAC.1